MGLFDFVADVATGGIYGAVTGKGFDITGKGAAAEQNQKAINAQQQIAGASNQTIRDMYQTGRQDQLPYMIPSLSALPMYQSAVLGGEVQYADPRYQRLTTFDPEYQQALEQYGGDKTMTFYRTPEGTFTNQAPTLTAKYDLQQDPGFQWRNKQLDRSLRSLGRSNSTYGMQAKADFSGNEYDRSLSRLSQLAGFGQGTASNVASQGGSAAGQTASVNSNLANSLSNLYGQRSQLYTDYSPLNLGLNAAKVGASFF